MKRTPTAPQERGALGTGWSPGPLPSRLFRGRGFLKRGAVFSRGSKACLLVGAPLFYFCFQLKMF